MPHQRLLRRLQLTTLAQSEDPVFVVYAAILILKRNLAECTGCTANFVILRGAHYRTTMLTSLLGTTIFLTIFFPAIAALIFSSARAFSTMVSSDASAGTIIRLRNLPLICTAISISSSFASSGTYFCKRARRRLSFSPKIFHSSCAREGAKGASKST